MATSALSRPAVASLPSYKAQWAVVLFAALALVWWSGRGAAGARRRGLEAARVPAALRTDEHFIVAALPRVTVHGKDSTLRHEAFEEIAAELRRRGYHTIGLSDLADFYSGRSRLPPKSILLALDRDNPESVRLVDRVLRRLDWRAVAFMERGLGRRGSELRRALSNHAVAQMLLGGAWEFGTTLLPGSVMPVEGPGRGAVLWGLTPHRVDVPRRAAVAILMTKTGYNDRDIPPAGLRAVVVRPEAPVNETIASIEAFQPRVEPFEDLFRGARLGPDWVADWGVIAADRERMAVLPQPGQRSASVTLKGTDRWTDLAVEFSILRYRREAWVLARSREPERWVRFGLENGFWQLQQKTGPDSKPVTLAQAPLREGLPAEARLILKGNWAIAYVGGRVQFGKGVWVDDAVGFGRLQFMAQSPEPGVAKAVFGFVRACPILERWLAFEPSPERSPELLGALRAQAAEARTLSPHWLTAGPRGAVRVSPPDELTRALAGFYRCKLVPSVTFAVWPAPDEFRASAAALAAAAEALGVPGINVRLPAATPGARGLARELRDALWRRRRLLWVTAAGPNQAEVWRPYSEAVFLSAGGSGAGVELLRRAKE